MKKALVRIISEWSQEARAQGSWWSQTLFATFGSLLSVSLWKRGGRGWCPYPPSNKTEFFFPISPGLFTCAELNSNE